MPEVQGQRLKALEALREEQENNLKAVIDEITRVARSAIEQNMHPDKKLLAEIAERYDLSSTYGISRSDFDEALSKIGNNENVVAQLRCLKATGAEMTIISVDASEVLLIDAVANVNVGAQEEFLSGLDKQERSKAVSSLQQRFPDIETFLQRSDDARGLNYYEYLLVCEISGAEPIPEDEYRELQRHKPVDREMIGWLFSDKARLVRGLALRGDRREGDVVVHEFVAVNRFGVRGGRARLRVYWL